MEPHWLCIPWVTAGALPRGDFTFSIQMNINRDEFHLVSSLESGRIPGCLPGLVMSMRLALGLCV